MRPDSLPLWLSGSRGCTDCPKVCPKGKFSHTDVADLLFSGMTKRMGGAWACDSAELAERLRQTALEQGIGSQLPLNEANAAEAR